MKRARESGREGRQRRKKEGKMIFYQQNSRTNSRSSHRKHLHPVKTVPGASTNLPDKMLLIAISPFTQWTHFFVWWQDRRACQRVNPIWLTVWAVSAREGKPGIKMQCSYVVHNKISYLHSTIHIPDIPNVARTHMWEYNAQELYNILYRVCVIALHMCDCTISDILPESSYEKLSYFHATGYR